MNHSIDAYRGTQSSAAGARPDTWTIGGLAHTAAVGVETIRYYQRRGLLRTPPRPAGSVRRYGRADLARLRLIRAAQALGFSLREIAALLEPGAALHCAAVRVCAEHKLLELRKRVARLQRAETRLQMLIGRCQAAPPREPCPLLEQLQVQRTPAPGAPPAR